MKIHLSSATLQSYENKNKSMDLFYNPIMIFEDLSSKQLEQIKNISWKITSKQIGTHDFEVLVIQKPSFKDLENISFVEFRLVKKDIAFIPDDYPCKINFTATLGEEKIEYETLGVVKTKRSKGLI